MSKRSHKNIFKIHFETEEDIFWEGSWDFEEAYEDPDVKEKNFQLMSIKKIIEMANNIVSAPERSTVTTDLAVKPLKPF